MNNGELPAHPASADKYNLNEMGLTKREYFAGLAMSCYSQHPSYYTGSPEVLAKEAVKLADCLLAELEKPQS